MVGLGVTAGFVFLTRMRKFLTGSSVTMRSLLRPFFQTVTVTGCLARRSFQCVLTTLHRASRLAMKMTARIRMPRPTDERFAEIRLQALAISRIMSKARARTAMRRKLRLCVPLTVSLRWTR